MEAAAWIKQLVEQQMQVPVIRCAPLGSGGSADLFLAELEQEPYRICVKAYRARGMNEQEAHQIRFLSAHSDMPFPKIYFTAQASEAFPKDTLAMEYIHGVNATDPRFFWKSPRKKQEFTQEVADRLLQLHGCTNDRFGDLDHPEFSSWEALYRPKAEDILKKTEQAVQERRFDSETYEVMNRAYRHYDVIFHEPVPQASLIHGDFWLPNVLVDSKTLHLAAVIDPFNSMWADREYELFALNNSLKKRFPIYEAYKKKTQVSQFCDLKCAFYNLYSETLWVHTLQSEFHPYMRQMAKTLVGQMKRFHIE